MEDLNKRIRLILFTHNPNINPKIPIITTITTALQIKPSWRKRPAKQLIRAQIAQSLKLIKIKHFLDH
jgi:hypothetical protein